MKKSTSVSGQKGFMNVFFVGALFIVLFSFLVLTKEAAEMRTRKNEFEIMLQFDYRVELYYLLLNSGYLSLEKTLGYGDLLQIGISETFREDGYIEIRDNADRIEIIGFLFGKERGRYEIRK